MSIKYETIRRYQMRGFLYHLPLTSWQNRFIWNLSNDYCIFAAMQLSVKQYADKIGLTRQGVLWRINHGISLPEVLKVEKVGKAYVITLIS